MVSFAMARPKSALLLCATVLSHSLYSATPFQSVATKSILLRPSYPSSSSQPTPLSAVSTASYLDSLSPVSTTSTTTIDTSDTTNTPPHPTQPIDIEMATVQLLLDRALRSDATAAKTLLDTVSTLRSTATQSEMQSFLDLLLSLADAKPSRWTRLRVLNRFSRRARRASLSRVLTLSTPSAEEENGGDDGGRRRRALVLVLRSLASVATTEGSDGIAIRTIEKTAREDRKNTATYEDMASRVPEGLETPDFEIVARRDGYDVRKYEAFSVCSVPTSKPRPDSVKTDRPISQPQLSGASSFGALAGYLFGKNTESTAMKMTTPVLMTGSGDEKQMSFVLPSTYWSEDKLSTAPRPLDGSLVTLRRDEGGNRAVVMFGGFASKADVEVEGRKLREGLERDGEWKVVEGEEEVTVAQYNDPFTPPWKRRNEVSLSVIKR